MLAVLLALQASFPSDTTALARAGALYHVPAPIMWAVAVVESGHDRVRGQTALGPGRPDSTGRKVCHELGRLQISPCIWAGRLVPACDSLTVYWANLRCGAAILAAKFRQTGSWWAAIRAYNGGGPKATEAAARAATTYALKVSRLVGNYYLLRGGTGLAQSGRADLNSGRR